VGWTFFGGHKEGKKYCTQSFPGPKLTRTGLIHVQQKEITPETRSKVFQDILVLVVVVVVLVVMCVVERRQTEMGAMLTLKGIEAIVVYKEGTFSVLVDTDGRTQKWCAGKVHLCGENERMEEERPSDSGMHTLLSVFGWKFG
jgi:hypothetical protein